MSAAEARLRPDAQPLLVLVAVIVVAAVSIATAGIRLHREFRALEEAQEALAALARRAQALRDQSSRRQRLQRAVNALAPSGFVTKQRAPRWAQALRAAGLADVDVEVLRDPEMSTATLGADPGLIVRDSLVRVRMAVLHEVELLRRLDALSAAPAGLMRAQRCSLRRSASQSTSSAPPLLSADCEIGWTDALVVDLAEAR